MITKEELAQIVSELNREYSPEDKSDGNDIIQAISGHDNYNLAYDGNKLIVCYDCLTSKYPYIDKEDMKNFLAELIELSERRQDQEISE